ncbi:MAG: hypothetical protein AB1393_13155, partial [Candidatus Edwardsbacteria bacterium]
DFSSPACLGGASEIAQAQTGKHISILLPMKILHIYHTIFDSTLCITIEKTTSSKKYVLPQLQVLS